MQLTGTKIQPWHGVAAAIVLLAAFALFFTIRSSHVIVVNHVGGDGASHTTR